MAELNAISFKNFTANDSILFASNMPTLFAKYIIISQAKKRFAAAIVTADVDKKYHAVSSNTTYNEAEYKALVKENYNCYLAYLEYINKFKANNKDIYTIQYSIPNVAPYIENYKFNIAETFGIEDIIQGYKAANEIYKTTDWGSLRTVEKRVVKPEFKDEYKNIDKEFMNKTGWVGFAELKSRCSTIIEPTTRLKLDRSKATNLAPLEKFSDNLEEFLSTFSNFENINTSEDEENI